MKRYITSAAVLLVFFLLNTGWGDAWVSLAPTPYWQYIGSALVLGRPSDTSLYAIFATTKTFDRYYANRNYWDPTPADFPGNVNFGPGAALTSDRSNIIYALAGGATPGNKREFWRYRISDNSWLRYPDIPADVNAGGALAYAHRDGFAWVYAIVGGGDSAFYKYGPVALPGQGDVRDIPRWRKMASLYPYTATSGACLGWCYRTSPAETDTIFCLPMAGAGNRFLRAYSPVSNTWAASLSLTTNAGPGAAMATWNRTNVDAYMHCLCGSYPYLDNEVRWRGPGGPWAPNITDTPQDQYPGAAIAHGQDQWVYAFFGSTSKLFYKHFYWERFDVGGEQAAGSAGSPASGLTVYPNPATRRAGIRFAQSEQGRCRVTVYDVAGTAVRTLLDRSLPGGSHSLSWDRLSDNGREMPAGVYVVRVSTDHVVEAAKLVVE